MWGQRTHDGITSRNLARLPEQLSCFTYHFRPAAQVMAGVTKNSGSTMPAPAIIVGIVPASSMNLGVMN